MRQYSNGAVEVAEPRLNRRERRLGIWFVDSIGRIISHCASCLLQCMLLVTKAGISKRENIWQPHAVRRNNKIWRGLDRLNRPRKNRTRFVGASRPFLAVTQPDQQQFLYPVERLSRFRRHDLWLNDC